MKKHQLLKHIPILGLLFHLSSLCFAQVPVFGWSAVYDGPDGAGYNYVNSMIVDASGNVYVSGYSIGYDDADYATIKYNSAGVQQWVARYNGTGDDIDIVHALAVDAAGNVYVTGESISIPGGYDYVTIKYNSSGVQQWLARYNGPATLSGGINSKDIPWGLAVDGAGNVYVTGQSSGLGLVFFYDDCTTVKYNAAGVQQWVSRYNNPANNFDMGEKISLDASGNVIVAGISTTFAGGGSDILTVKYNPAGVQQWVRLYDGPAHDYDEPTALVTDASGNIVVAGYITTISGKTDYIVIKYNSFGIAICTPIYNGPGNDNDRIGSAVLDAAGNIYVTGASIGAGTNVDYATIKYNSSGVQQWVARYNGPTNYIDNGNALALDNFGNVYVTGKTVKAASIPGDYTTIKYNSAGVQQWYVKYDGGDDDNPVAIAVDALNQVYVAGSSIIHPSHHGYFTIRYNQVTLLPPGGPPIASRVPDQITAANFRISNFPNPVSTTSRIQYELPYNGHVSIKIFDVLGREITTLVNADMQVGIRSTEFNASSLQKGIYYYTITLQREKEVSKRTGEIVVAR